MENTSTSTTTTTTVVASRSILVAYLLWFFLGSLGIHRFYLGKKGSAIAQLILGVIGYATTFLIVGFFILGVLGIWLIVDIFLIPGMVATSATAGQAALFQTVTTTVHHQETAAPQVPASTSNEESNQPE